jgi:hypothetical protein
MGETRAPSYAWVGDDTLFKSGLKLSAPSMGTIVGGAAIAGVVVVIVVVR